MGPPLDIKLEIVFDSSVKYFPGDQVKGMIFLTANRNYSLRNFRLAWTGRIQVKPVESDKDGRTYFDECWKLGSTLVKSPTKAARGSSHVPLYITNLVLAQENNQEPKVELQKNKTLGLTFKVRIPNDRPLPSCTNAKSRQCHIIYLLEAFIGDSQISNHNKPVFFAQKIVPVFELIYTRTPEMTTPQRAEQVFMVSLFEEKMEFTSAMRVTLPCRGSQPGIAIPISISIWNNLEFVRKEGIHIELLRIVHIISNNSSYKRAERVCNVKTDLNVTSDNDTTSNQKVQTVRITLPIPRDTIPTISFEQSQLFSLSYLIRVEVTAQKGLYTTSEGIKSELMKIELPFVVGTATLPGADSSPTLAPKNASSPTLSNRSVSPLSTFTSMSSIFAQHAHQNQRQSFDVCPSTETLATENYNDTFQINKKGKKGMGNVFRKSSNGSNASTTSSEEKSKRKGGVFSMLRLYSSKKNNQDDSENEDSQKEDQRQISPAVIMTPKQQNQEQGGVFDIFAGDDLDDDDDIPKDFSEIEHKKNSMQDHGDSTTLISGSNRLTPPLVSQSTEATQGRFQMFSDEDDSDNEEVEEKEKEKIIIQKQDSVAMTTIVDQKINSMANKVEHSTLDNTRSNQQAAAKQSRVFKMFEDSDDEDEEDIVDQLTVSQDRIEVLLDERVKPHHEEENDRASAYSHSYKLNTVTDSSDEEPDEGDLLASLARRERK
ncbi:hypothetical protein BD408DRAFT_434202 [Parasitella parasitica]|nr:hypothetical protein BD408DRAFT_434202 [Parasitella parasitica]